MKNYQFQWLHSSSLPLYNNLGEKLHKPHAFKNYSSMATFLSMIVKAHVHSFTRGRLKKPQHTYIKWAVCKAHFKLNRTFKVILIGVSRNPEQGVVIMYNNGDLISES